MKRFLFTLLLTIAYSCFSQQTALIDSLKNELKNRKIDDSVKVSILTLLHEKLMFSQPEEAKNYALEEIEISKKLSYKRGLGVGHMHLGNYHSNRSENDSALYYYDIAKQYFKEVKSTRGIIFINHSISGIKEVSGELDDAIAITKETLKTIIENEAEGDLKTKFIGAQHASLSNIYIEKGNYRIALIEALKALKCFEDINHESRKADVLKQIGDIESALENHESSVRYFKQAIEIYERLDDKIYGAYAHNSLGISYQNMQNYEDARTHYNLAMSYSKDFGSKIIYANALKSLAQLQIIDKNYTQAKLLLLEAKIIGEKENLQLSLADIYDELSKVEYLTNNLTQALANNDKTIEIAKTAGALLHLKNSYKTRSDILLKMKNAERAIYFLRESQKLNDSIYNTKKAQQIEELKTIYETDKKETALVINAEEIKNLNQEVEISNLRKGIYAGGMFTFLAVSSLLYFGFKQRIKKRRIAHEKETEIYKQKIDFKQRELVSQTLHIVQKKTFLKEIQDSLERIKNDSNLSNTEFKRLIALLKKENATDRDWETFKSYFSEVHSNFDSKLKKLSPEISEKEIRLAAFLRMKLSTKEIAAMLNVLPDSVKKSKYRLKNKLSLDKEDNLIQFLNTI